MRKGKHPSASHRRLGLRAAAGLLVGAVVVLSATGCFLFPNSLPIVLLEADPTDGIAPLVVHFDATGSYDPDGVIQRYRWEFGDGSSGTGATIAHTYALAGTYHATLTVIDRRGGSSSLSVAILVRGSNALPVAAFSMAPSPAYPQQLVRFDAAASYDPDGHIASYEWDFGDGTADTGSSTVHKYAVQGTYDVALSIRDNDGGERTATAELRIATQIEATATVSRHYEWTYGGRTQSCDLEIPMNLYAYYKSQPRGPWTWRDYDEYVLDPLDDAYLEDVTDEVLGGSSGDYHAALENALFFVQHCIQYVYDPAWYEYPRYPIETLVDRIGDCEDTAILYTSLVRTLGYGALMVAVDTDGNGVADHMAAWVPVESSFVALHPDRSFWTYNHKTYAFAETAVEGGYLPLGVDPWGLTEASIDTIYDVSRVDREPQAVRIGP